MSSSASLTPHAAAGHAPDAPAYVTRQGRDLRIDMLRGFFVLAMIVNHISGASPFYLLTGGDRFLTSAAEGFILISGYTAGMVYRRLIRRDGLVNSMIKAFRRAFSLYLLTVGLTFFLAPLSELFQLPWAGGLDLSRGLKFVISVLTLHRTYTFVNIMLLYTLLFLALPLALLLLEHGRARLLLLAAWLLWLVYRIYPEPATFPWQVDGGQLFAFSSWQALFFTTLVLGYHRDALPRVSARGLARLHGLTGLAFAAAIGVYILLHWPAGLAAGWAANLFDKAGIGPGRIAAAAAVFGFLFISLTRWWPRIPRWVRGFLLPFGQHALYAWTAHILVIVGIGLALKALGLGEDNPWLNTGLQIAAVALIWFITKRQFLAVNAHNRRYWYAAPALLAVLALLTLQLPFFDALPAPGLPPGGPGR